jgi:hypothetical protein
VKRHDVELALRPGRVCPVDEVAVVGGEAAEDDLGVRIGRPHSRRAGSQQLHVGGGVRRATPEAADVLLVPDLVAGDAVRGVPGGEEGDEPAVVRRIARRRALVSRAGSPLRGLAHQHHDLAPRGAVAPYRGIDLLERPRVVRTARRLDLRPVDLHPDPAGAEILHGGVGPLLVGRRRAPREVGHEAQLRGTHGGGRDERGGKHEHGDDAAQDDRHPGASSSTRPQRREAAVDRVDERNRTETAHSRCPPAGSRRSGSACAHDACNRGRRTRTDVRGRP